MQDISNFMWNKANSFHMLRKWAWFLMCFYSYLFGNETDFTVFSYSLWRKVVTPVHEFEKIKQHSKTKKLLFALFFKKIMIAWYRLLNTIHNKDWIMSWWLSFISRMVVYTLPILHVCLQSKHGYTCMQFQIEET